MRKGINGGGGGVLRHRQPGDGPQKNNRCGSIKSPYLYIIPCDVNFSSPGSRQRSNCQLFYLCSAHRFLSTSDKQREVGQSSCLLCPSLEQQSICDLFCEMVPFLFSNSSTVREGAVADKG